MANTPDEAPDLILVVGEDGIEGYAEKHDILPPPPSSPEEAVALMTERRTTDVGRSLEERTVPVYAVDDRTVISEFTITSLQ